MYFKLMGVILSKLKNPQEIIKQLTSDYDKWAIGVKENNYNTIGVWFNTDSASIYVRNMARGILSGELVFCISNINVNKEYQGKGIFTSFLRHVLKNPYAFSEVEVENICNEDLLSSLLKKGFKSTKDLNIIEIEALTVTKKIK